MQLPTRRSQKLKQHEDDSQYHFLTAAGLEWLKRDLRDIETIQRPQAVEDVSTAVQKGDLSENAEYQEAKSRLARIDSRIFSLKERIKRTVIIEQSPDPSGRVRLGSTVVVEMHGERKTYELVGPQETNPTRGRISHLSPLGSALLNHIVGDIVEVETQRGKQMYVIVEVK